MDTELSTIHIPQITSEHIEAYGNVSNDFSLLHFNKDAAQNSGFPNRIAHGMLSMGMSTRLISSWLSNQRMIKDYETSFLRPLILGDSLTIEGKVTALEKEQEIKFSAYNQHDEKIIAGRILIEGDWK